jgi:uncharacterized protein (DUF1015 family)
MEIKAFKAVRFNDAVVGDSSKCICPPYDVIDAQQRECLYQRHPYNIVRIELGKTTPNDTENNNQYTRANDFFQKWIAEKALLLDEKPAIYAYVQDFDVADQKFQRSGFIALGKVVEFGKNVKPHEKTLEGPKADRLNLMKATKAQFGQIFMLYDDPQKIADKIIAESANGKTLIDATDDDGTRHRLFAIQKTQDIEAIVKMMADKDTVIADGHHRYETSLNYYNLTQNPAAQHCMMTFVNMHNKGLVILPTHRLVGNLSGFDSTKLLKGLEKDFEITKFSLSQKDKMFAMMKQNFDANKVAFGLYVKDNAFYCIVLRTLAVMDKLAPALSKASKSLDVSVLHTVILDGILGIGDKQLAAETNIEYIKDIGDAINKSITLVDSDDKQLVFFMNPTKIEQVQAVAATGEKMPQKSTFFHPKIYSGLTVNKL